MTPQKNNEIVQVRREVQGLPYLDPARRQLQADIRYGRFTPFLGAGVSSLRPEQVRVAQEPWKQVAKILTAVCSELKGDLPGISFLRSFALQRLGMNEDTFRNHIQDAEIETVFEGNRLVKLQAALVRGAMRLTCYFGASFAKHSPSVGRIREVEVPFDISDEHAARAVEALFDSVDRAQELHEKPQDSFFPLGVSPEKRRRLRTQRIHEKLLTLILILVSREEVTLAERFRRHRRTLEKLPDVFRELVGSDRHLRLDAVQWLSDLLWYTVRYWVPRYPTTDELAFELSLGVKDGPARRAELPQAAQALSSTEDPYQEIRDLMAYCDNGRESLDPETGAFSYAIAAALQHQYDLYRRTLAHQRPLRRFKGGGQKLGSGAGGSPVPILFTTNFDQALESVFKDTKLPYHVVFPMIPGRTGDGSSAEPKSDAGGVGEPDRPLIDPEEPGILWLIRTYEHGTEPFDQEWSEICPPGQEPQETFRGPIFVKLHGSPSEPLSDGDQHWLVLSEEGYLQALREWDRMPEWLKRQLRTTYDHEGPQRDHTQHGDLRWKCRSIWFLGYSFSDWNVRLHLYKQCHHSQGFRSTIDRDDDLYRIAILDNLKVQHWKGDLNRLPSMIDSVLDDDDFPTSSGVDELIEKLRKFSQE